MWIVIDDGDTFEGTMEQFLDCFGGPATKERVYAFGKEVGTTNIRITDIQ